MGARPAAPTDMIRESGESGDTRTADNGHLERVRENTLGKE
jgi:hypothetical protein